MSIVHTEDHRATPALAPEARGNAIVTWRSVAVGSALSLLTAVLTPFNDYVVMNMPVVGSYLPSVLVVSLFLLGVVVNPLLYRFRPRSALSMGELAVITAMLLVACGIPSQGLLRQLLPQAIWPYYIGRSDPTFWANFKALGLPDWLFVVSPRDPDALNHPLVQFFYSRLPAGAPIPWAPWVLPIAAWGTFILMLFVALMGVVNVIRRQWMDNERLLFPLAQVQLAMIETPAPGQYINDLFRARSFWFALVAVTVIHSLSAYHLYDTKSPIIPIAWNLNSIFSEEPWIFLSTYFKRNSLFFTFIGISYFIQSRVAFSLWSMVVIQQIIKVQAQVVSNPIAADAWKDQHLGACVAFAAGIFWIGRHHYLMVARQAFLPPRPSEPVGDLLSYRTSAWMIIVGIAGMLAWLLVVGVSFHMALLFLAFLLGGHLVITRFVAETGLPYIRLNAFPSQVLNRLPVSYFSTHDAYFSGVTSMLGTQASRESLLTFAAHGTAVVDNATEGKSRRSGGRLIIAAMAVAMLLTFVAGCASSLWCYYRYATPLALSSNVPINNWGAATWPRDMIVTSVNSRVDGRFPAASHNPALHMGIGVAVMALLQLASWRWAAWPFAPVGYLVTSSYYIEVACFSIFLGWFAKSLIVHFGGSTLYRAAKPFFIGLIIGESVVGVLWLLINLFLALQGIDYKPAQFLPI